MSLEIIFPTEPTRPSWWDEPCTKAQREIMDRLRLEARIYYDQFLIQASKVVERAKGNEIKRLGGVTKREAKLIIDWLNGNPS